MNVFEVLADPVRRRLIELLADGERRAGELTDVIRTEFGVSQPAVSNALRVLREAGGVEQERVGTARIYRLRAGAFEEAESWLSRYGGFWSQRLDALETEVARERRKGADDVVRRTAEGTDRNVG